MTDAAWAEKLPSRLQMGASSSWTRNGRERWKRLLDWWQDGSHLGPLDTADPELVALLQVVAELLLTHPPANPDPQ